MGYVSTAKGGSHFSARVLCTMSRIIWVINFGAESGSYSRKDDVNVVGNTQILKVNFLN